MATKRFIARPTASPGVQWTGDNISEIEEYGSSAGWIVVDNGTTASIYTEEGDPPGQVFQFTMQMNDWVGVAASVRSDEWVRENYQEVPDEDPLMYVFKKDPNV